ncbi:MogA/MoaB family molybdenum cofactor biosynthesis protein [Kribbia dieselivorans]|uniref:MogA/MoaB family molybdenum cofactor biosynthesis protein n=1 Tax=Kribbia dieselivorans TaxID=331526 RepID=UPI0009FB4BA9|nr:MogA/MoaB family molybdenum cofactor biosynthesis protein [Kribbia dieselivorans]
MTRGASVGVGSVDIGSVGIGSVGVPGRVITVSDRVSAGVREDRSGPLAVELLAAHGVAAELVVVPDGHLSVRAAIVAAVDAGARVVFTTGGTGVGPRDQTPEATAEVLALRLDGVAEEIRRVGSAHVATAVLSRGLVGVTGRGARAALVVNAPGSTGGVRDAVTVVGPLIGHILDQVAGGDH